VHHLSVHRIYYPSVYYGMAPYFAYFLPAPEYFFRHAEGFRAAYPYDADASRPVRGRDGGDGFGVPARQGRQTVRTSTHASSSFRPDPVRRQSRILYYNALADSKYIGLEKMVKIQKRTIRVVLCPRNVIFHMERRLLQNA